MGQGKRSSVLRLLLPSPALLRYRNVAGISTCPTYHATHSQSIPYSVAQHVGSATPTSCAPSVADGTVRPGQRPPPTFPMGSAPCVDEATANEAISLRAPRSFDDTALTKITGQYPIHAPSPLTEHQTINTSITTCREISSTVRPLPVPISR